MSALDDAINQNTRADDTVHPAGLPTNYGEYGGAVPGTLPPSGWSAVQAWGQIYPEAGSSASVNDGAQIQIQDLQTWVLLNTGQWVEVQNQATEPVGGAEYVANYA